MKKKTTTYILEMINRYKLRRERKTEVDIDKGNK